MKSLLILLLASAAALADTVTKTVEYDHGGTKFDSFLAYDSTATADAKRPGVLVVPEWWGLNDFAKEKAKELAAMGYVALAVDMYGGGVSTTEASEAKGYAGKLYGSPEMPGRAQAALDQLLKTGLVDSSKVGAIGFCFGGSTCQTLAYSGAPIAGIVSFHGGLVQPTAEQAGAIKCKILMCNGAIDPNVKPEAITAFTQALEAAHVDYQWINYAGARHAFTNPDADKLAAANNMTAMVAYNEPAARRSWALMKSFFDEVFGAK